MTFGLLVILAVIVLIGAIVVAVSDPATALALGLIMALGIAVGAGFLVVDRRSAEVAQRSEEPEPPEAPERGIRQRETLEPGGEHVILTAETPSERETADVAASDGPMPKRVREVVHSPNRGATAGRELERLPDWVRTGTDTRSGDEVDLVLSSQRFATLDEARDQLWSELAAEVLEHQQEAYPEMRRWKPDREETLKGGLLQRECIVTWPLEVGGFDEEVYQLHWDVQLNAQTRARLHARWRPGEVQRRLTYLGLLLGGVTITLGTGTWAARGRLTTGETRRN